jgi:methionine-rich copper-binding protein CopC
MDRPAPRRYTAPRAAPERIAVIVRLKIWLPVVLAVLLMPVVGQAHAILEDSTPAAGASVKAGPVDLRFRYNSRIDRTRSRLTLIRPDRSHTTLPIIAGSSPDIIAARVSLVPGAYVIRWQVLAVDGHITRGDVPVVVAAP